MLKRNAWMIPAFLFPVAACAHMPWGHHRSPYKMTIRHQVADYAQWRPVFDEHRGAREAAGLTRCKVQQGADDPNLVSLSCDAADLRKAKDFAASADLKEAMKKAGVTGEPTIFFGKPAPKQCGGD